MSVSKLALSLFWRTFFLLAMLLAGGVFAWVQTFRALEAEPRALQSAQQLASLVNLTRSALLQTDGINRIAMVKTMSDEDTVKVLPREKGDRWQAYESDTFTRSIADGLRAQLGPGTVVAKSVNDQAGLWVGFNIDTDPFWLRTDLARVQPVSLEIWGPWVAIALIATILGSVGIARLINEPLRELSSAASRIREGEYDSRLDENTRTSEIREVNMGFNRMARELAKVDEDRAVMLAGISHDLRTPLARLRLEAEMSVHDEEARRNMALDIDQLDAIIDKFLDYSRPGEVMLEPVPLALLVEREINAFRNPEQIRIRAQVPGDIMVLADDTELGRVLQNLFENARRYGLSAASGMAEVEVSAERVGAFVNIRVRDHGAGVPPEKLAQLTTPFFRGDTARTAATGAGLGLAIVEKALQRMGGSLELQNAPGGGLLAIVQMRRTAA
ncbi:ATP-binding protein [Roseateles toxinivorans]|uniref:histidine kinase n=1 Tax=Roseateles toxinivorans TaxID=270368 RepID=A0A4R6QTZ3_9BURK|nr:ATP-binding protein [Roseateles toxinivorans]TDP74369.1 two-component system osmolarity sensor histidine kinase EnvZ [Roseateles toxinivorans]